MATISLVATRSGSGPTSTITLTSGDTTNAKAWAPPPFNPTVDSDLGAAKEAILQEVLRQLAAV